MKIEVKKTITHGEFAKYMVDKFGIASFERNLADGEWFGEPSDRYNASINLKPAKYDDFAYSIRIDEDGVTFKTFEEITEDTVIPKLIERWKHGEDGNETSHYVEHENKNINKVLFVNSKRIVATHFYAEIDGELKLIWRDGRLVE